MKAIKRENAVFQIRAFVAAAFLVAFTPLAQAVGVPAGGGTNSAPVYTPLDSWSFHDSVGWTSDTGYAPVSFTNLSFSILGDGASLVVDTNVPAWLQYNVYESDNTTNLTVDFGTLTFWYAPAAWAATNAGGTGPGATWAQLINIGEWTPDASSGYWGLAVDSAGSNLWFQAQDGAGDAYSLSTPISWSTNYFHFIALTYSSTNVSIYLDGQLVTNDPGGLSVWPGPDVLAGGIYFGSDTNGLMQAGGSFNSVVAYGLPVDAGTIQQTFNQEIPDYQISPWNPSMWVLTSATSSPAWTNGFDAITGPGNLQLDATGVPGCVEGTTPFQVWFTNVTALATNGGTAVTFTIAGGQPGFFYDVFATGALQNALTNSIFCWLGQGQACNTYTVNITSENAFLILGTPQDTDNDGLTDAYELLVSKTNPNNPSTSGDGISDADKILLGLNPLVAYPAVPTKLSITTCPE